MNKIHLNPLTITNIPLQVYNDKFTFVVNKEEFKTSKIVSDLLSPHICRAHAADPTFNKFEINTIHHGNFSHILHLIDFKEQGFPTSEIQFISEVIEILGNDKIEISKGESAEEITIDNVLPFILEHEKYETFFSDALKEEIVFISKNFGEIYEKDREKLKKLQVDTLYRILNNDELQIKYEDDLINFVNELYLSDSKYSILYEQICFQNITSKKMIEFIEIFNMNDITNGIWKVLSNRLTKEIKFYPREKYNSNGLVFPFTEENLFSGIINYLKSKSEGNLIDKVNITSSSCINYSKNRQAFNVAYNNDNNSYFFSGDFPNSWICFDFKSNRVCPTNYTIKTANGGSNDHYPKSWVIEASNDKNEWEIIDRQENCIYLKGSRFVHTFAINNANPNGFRFIRMRQTSTNWFGSHRLLLDSFEFFGTLI